MPLQQLQQTGSGPAASQVWISGVFALAGVVIGLVASLAAGYFDRREQRRAFLRARLQELSEESTDAIPWLLQLSQCQTTAEVMRCPPSPGIRKMFLLSLIYFPQLRTQATNYYNFLMETYRLAVAISPSEPEPGWTVGAKIAKARHDAGRAEDELQKLGDALDRAVEHYATRKRISD